MTDLERKKKTNLKHILIKLSLTKEVNFHAMKKPLFLF